MMKSHQITVHSLQIENKSRFLTTETSPLIKPSNLLVIQMQNSYARMQLFP